MPTVLVPLANGCEELEAITITDLLTRAGADVTTAGLTDGPIKAGRGAQLLPDISIDDAMNRIYDLIVLPGGQPGADTLMKDTRVQQLIRQQHESEQPLAAICAAPRALAHAGILEGCRVTCYPGALDEFEGSWTNTGSAVETSGHIITGRGPGVAMDFALSLVERLFGPEHRSEVESALAR